MIDIHSHILPSIDDGAKTETDSIAIARAAVAEGITQMIATPHHKTHKYFNDRTSVMKHVDLLNQLLQNSNVPLTVLPGQELRINGDILTDYDMGEIIPLNDSKYILIEFPDEDAPRYADQLFYDLQMAGFVPIIAHPERNQGLIQDPIRLYNLVRNGALTQITAASVIGKFGKQIQGFSQEIIEANLTHFVASDVHNTETRGSYLKEAYDWIRDTYGMETYYTFNDNSALVAENLNVNRSEPQPIRKKRKKLFGLI